jgi:hypothetical protein
MLGKKQGRPLPHLSAAALLLAIRGVRFNSHSFVSIA